MNFKLFLPLSALALLVASCQDETKGLTNGSGTISPEFTIDYSVSNPRTQSRAESTPESMPKGDTPELSGFSFRLVKDDGKFDKTFTGLGEFVGTDFPVGAYSLEATYGDIEEEGAGKPYFEGSTTFNVYDGEETQPTLVAKLANTAVTVEYTEAFINYFTAYSTEIHSSNGTNTIEMPTIDQADTSSDWVYVKPGNVTITIDVTKQNGVNYKVEAATITDAQPGTHYHVKVDANGGEVGNATITVTFDDTTDLQPIEIDVSDDILVTPAPVLTAYGFTSGTPLEILEGDAAEGTLKVNILAQGEVASVKLNISSPTPALSSLQGDVNLLAASEEQKTALQTLGVTTKGIWSGVGKVAEIDFTAMLPKLTVANGNSTHTFTITVVDKLNRTCDPVVLKIEAPKPVLVISNQRELAYRQTTAEFDFTYNGKDIQNKVKFQATNAGDDWEDCTYSSVVDNGGGSYHVVINIPLRSSDSKVRAIYNKTTSAEYTFKRKIELAAADYDVWATKATVSMSPAAMRSQVTAIYLNDVQKGTTFNDYSQFTFTGLTPGTQYTAKAVLSNGTEATVTFTTEAATQVPNGDFEDLTVTYDNVTMDQGGKYSVWPADYQNTQTFTIKEPNGWKSTNSTTCNLSKSNINSWFCVPSAYNTSLSWSAYRDFGIENKTPDIYSGLAAQYGSVAMVIRNVGWDMNGKTPNKSGGAFNTKYYCENIPTVANVSAGQLSLDDKAFTVRPASLQGYYKYSRDGLDASEKAVVTVTLLNGGTEIGKGSAELDAADAYTLFSVPVTYSVTNKKADELKIMITSSNRAAGSIKVSDHLGEREASKYGAILTVDNLTFSY